MTDVTSISTDMNLFDTDVARATNILSVQVGSLEYAQDLGIDLEYFLSPDFKFQNESFNSYLVQVLANNRINVASVTAVIQALYEELTFDVNRTETNSGLIAR